jgi:DNA-binding NarL/FixJ family response regulator
MPVKVLVVDELPAVGEALHRALAASGGFDVVGISRSHAEVSPLVAETRPDVVLVHEAYPGADGGATSRALSSYPEIPVVAMISDASDEHLGRMVSAGVSGLVRLRRDEFETLLTTLRRAAAGEVLLSPADLRRVIQRQRVQLQRDRRREDVLRRLTRREVEVLGLVARGLDNRKIAATMHVSVTTVRSHVQRILSKLDVHSKLEATVLANEYDLIAKAPRD